MMPSDKLRQKLIDDYWFGKLLAVPPSGKKNAGGQRLSARAAIGSAGLTELCAIANHNAIGEFILLLSVYGVLLHRYFDMDGFLICSSDLRIDGVEPGPGHPLFYSVGLDDAGTLREFIRAMQDEVGAAINHRNFDYEGMRLEFPRKGIVGTDIFRFGFRYAAINGDWRGLNDPAFLLHIDRNGSGGMDLELAFDDGITDAAAAERFLVHYLFALTHLSDNIPLPARQIRLLPDEEAVVIKETFNLYTSATANYSSIVDRFAARVAADPTAIAIQTGASRLTYRELGQRSDDLARDLVLTRGLQKGQPVGLLADWSEWTIVGILGILKAGGVFVPIDPRQPRERMKMIVEDAVLELLLAGSEHLFDLDWFEGGLVIMDIETEGTAGAGCPLPPTGQAAHDPACIIYTSGTTGRPKGVLVSGGSIVNYAVWFINRFGIGQTDSSLLLASLAFDLGYTAVWSSLLTGATLHLAGFDPGADPERLLTYLAEYRISYIKTTPSLFYMLTHVPGFKMGTSSLRLRLIVLGGEMIRKEDVELYWRSYPGTRIVNHYGPTESTIGCIFKPLTEGSGPVSADAPVIGRAIDHCEALILEENGTLTPIGLRGEIGVGGAGLAMGYVNNPELTASKFIAHPWRLGERLYRTGDLGRWMPNGDILLDGRKDNQLKVRGYRVEPGEVEAHLRRHEQITDAFIIPKTAQGGSPRMVAYYRAAAQLDERELKEFLGGYLPDYMIPDVFIPIDRVPLTPNGKIDAKKLPEAHGSMGKAGKACILPGNEAEKKILTVWRQVLGRDPISVDDNFFDIGGNSLSLVKVSSLLADVFPDLTVIDLFNYVTIGKLAAFVSDMDGGGAITVSGHTIALDAMYFADGEEAPDERADLRLRIGGALLADLHGAAGSEKMEAPDLLALLFAQSIADATGGRPVTWYTVADTTKGKILYPVTLDGGINKDIDSAIDIRKAAHLRFADKGPGTIVLLIYPKTQLSARGPLAGLFDLVLEIDDTDAGLLHCQFDYGSRLNPSMVEELVRVFANQLASIVKTVE